MDAWTELNQAAIRARIREREVEAAGERLATTARSAAARFVAAAHRALTTPRAVAVEREPARIGEPIASREAPCADCPSIPNAA
jgi:hypothetical protein